MLSAGRAEPLAPERRCHLLAYLASRNDWVSRDQLAGLFWPDRPNASARSNLRYVLLQTKQLPWLTGFELQGESVRWHVETDLRDFEDAVARHDWQAALACSGGPFLEGLEHGLSAPYADWLAFERDRLAALRRDALHARFAELESDPRQCSELARRALQSDPFDETALVASMRAQRTQGDSAAGLRDYEAFAERLAEELGVEPSSAARELALQLRGEVSRAGSVAVSSAAAPPAELVGRRIELAQLADLLSAPECRLLTVIGPGGIGKSRLVRSALSMLVPKFPDGSWWIELDDLSGEPQVIARIAARIGLALKGTAEPIEQVVARLQGQHALLVLDNAEHLPRVGRAIEALLERSAGLKVVTTSRARLHAAGEWLLPLEGLPVPDEDESDPDVLRAYDSVRLFELRARAANPAVDLRLQAGQIAALVRLVEGMPLAIELAASWLRVLPLDDLLDHLRNSIDLLAAGDRAIRSERSVRASFDRSWALLTPRERTALATLTVFAGDFSRQAALAVARSPLPVLAALVDKSLLRADAGRFSLHALIRQCAAGRLEDADVARSRHADFYAQLLARHTDFKHIDQKQALAEMGLEFSNALRAWEFALASGHPSWIRSMATPLLHFFEERGRYSEGIRLMESTSAALDEKDEKQRPALLVCQRAVATLRYAKGEFEAALAQAQKVLATCDAEADNELAKSCLNLLGLCHWQLSRHDEARDCFLHALKLAQQREDLKGVRTFSGNLALIERAEGRYETARQLLDQAITVDRRLGDALGLATRLNNLGNLHRTQHDYVAALCCLEEGLSICDTHGLTGRRPYLLINLGLVHQALGHFATASKYSRQALEEARKQGNRQIEIASLLAVARIEVEQRALDAARQLIGQALALAIGYPRMNLSAIAAYAHLVAARGERIRAARLWQLVADDPDGVAAEREEARQEVEKLALDADEAAAVRDRMTAVSPDVLARQLLEEITVAETRQQ